MTHRLRTTTGREIPWSALRRWQETGKPTTYEALRFKCDRCGEVDTLEVAEKMVTVENKHRIAGATKREQVCTHCKFLGKTLRKSPSAAASPASETTTTTTTTTF